MLVLLLPLQVNILVHIGYDQTCTLLNVSAGIVKMLNFSSFPPSYIKSVHRQTGKLLCSPI